MQAESQMPAADAPRTEQSAQATTPVTTFEAMRRGARGRCPSCGRGHMFRAFLKVADQCPACGEELHHQRADDFPAYIVIVLVGHIVVPLVLEVEIARRPIGCTWRCGPRWCSASWHCCSRSGRDRRLYGARHARLRAGRSRDALMAGPAADFADSR
jgi:uncharacterized protein (DUF983 family)